MRIDSDSAKSAAVASSAPIITPAEAERYAEELAKIGINDVGSPRWMEQHVRLEKMNLQAHHCANAKSDDFVLEALVTFDQLGLLVHELLVVEAWRQNLFHRCKDTLAKQCSIRGYYILYHEATLCNLLEVILYHDYVAEAMGDAVVELVDYCARRLTYLVAEGPGYVEELVAKTEKQRGKTAQQVAADVFDPVNELEAQAADIAYRGAVSCVAIARYLTEHIKKLPLSAMTRIMDTHDYLLLMVPLIENPPWTRRIRKTIKPPPSAVAAAANGGDDGEKKETKKRETRIAWEKFVEQEWREVEPHNLLQLTNTEGQPWLVLYNLMCEGECRKRYHFNSHRKETVLRVRKYLNEVMLDQLPVLAHVQRYMDELSIMEAPAAPLARSALVMEQVPVIRDSLLRLSSQEWEDLAEIIRSWKEGRDDPGLKALAELYAGDSVEALLELTSSGSNRYGAEIVSATITAHEPYVSSKAPPRCHLEYCLSSLKPTPQQTSAGVFERFELQFMSGTGVYRESINAESDEPVTAVPSKGYFKIQLIYSDGTMKEFRTAKNLDLPTAASAGSDGDAVTKTEWVPVSADLPEVKWAKMGSLAEEAVVQVQLKRLPLAHARYGREGVDVYAVGTVFVSQPMA